MVPVVCLVGPTASGKTRIALELAKHMNCEIISMDSAMVYKGLDIGTAKPSPKERSAVVHHLIDINDPSVPYSAAQFQEDVCHLVKQIYHRKKMPLIVGGTMMYLNALQQGLSHLPAANNEIRERLLKEAENYGWQFLHTRLRQVDPEAADKIKTTDTQRIQRALEVYEITGLPLTVHWQNSLKQRSQFPMTTVILNTPERSILHEKIQQRFCQMLEDGFLDEVAKLYARQDLHIHLPAIRSVGYRQAWLYLDGKISYAEMSECAIIATRQLAKRQLTWLRRWNSEWLNSEDPDIISKILNILSIHT